jgi:phage tail sheath protein FI
VDWINSYDDASVVNSVNAKWRKIYKVLVYKKEKFETFDATWWDTNYSSPVESFYVSNDVSFVDNVGTSLFVEDVINGNSNYVYVRSNILDGTLPAVTDKAFALIGGQDSTNQSYFGRYAGWNLVYDRYNSSRVWLPNVIYAGSVCARVDRLLTPFEAPAGQDIGAIGAGRQNVEVNPTLGGQLYDLNINTVKFVRGVGNVLWGQKTAQLKKTARDRINVRRGLLQIEKTVERIMNAYMFKGNTAKLREKATTQVNAYLNPLKIAGSIQNYKVVCDSSNNPQSSIDAHILNIDLYIQPTSTVEFILVTTVVTNNSVMFTEGK